MRNAATTFVWKVGVGIEYELKNAFKDNSFLNNWAVKVDYYYMDAGEVATSQQIVAGASIHTPLKYDMRSNEIVALIRYNF